MHLLADSVDWAGISSTIAAVGVIVIGIITALSHGNVKQAQGQVNQVLDAVKPVNGNTNTLNADITAVKDTVTKMQDAFTAHKDFEEPLLGQLLQAHGLTVRSDPTTGAVVESSTTTPTGTTGKAN